MKRAFRNITVISLLAADRQSLLIEYIGNLTVSSLSLATVGGGVDKSKIDRHE